MTDGVAIKMFYDGMDVLAVKEPEREHVFANELQRQAKKYDEVSPETSLEMYFLFHTEGGVGVGNFSTFEWQCCIGTFTEQETILSDCI